jgi:hypothetical protein
MNVKIKEREKSAIINSLRAGVVPSIGLHLIQVGRLNEVEAILKDYDRVSEGSASIRFIIGEYGTGKSFFLSLARMVAVEKGFVVAQADITPEKRLHATTGQARALYSELMKNLATRSKPNGGALESVIQRFITEVEHEVRSKNGSNEDVKKEIIIRLRPLQDLVSGFDFATVIGSYFEGYQAGQEYLMDAALRWLRADFPNKTLAKQAGLNVSSIIDDRKIYDYLKLMATFTKLAGFKGMIVNLDEMGVLSHRLGSKVARDNNYETILNILNDSLQGNVANIGFIFAGTVKFIDDPKRGLRSYKALSDRLQDNSFAKNGLKDYASPVIRLDNLTAEELAVLFENIRNVFAAGDPQKYLVPNEALVAFLDHSYQALGADAFLSPRESVKEFVGFLSILEQNPHTCWQELLGGINFEKIHRPSEDALPDEEEASNDDDLVSLKL